MNQVAKHRETQSVRKLDYRRKMSDHIAWALLVYTGLHIFVTMNAIKGKGASVLPFLALVVLVIAIIPALRAFERRWNALSDAEASDTANHGRFRRDTLFLWLLAIGLPFALTALFTGLSSLG